MGDVPAPPGGLGSSSNYILYSDCKPITDLSVAIDVTQELFGNLGFSVQLNAYSPPGEKLTWQQYFLSLQTSNGPFTPCEIYGYIDNWPNPVSGPVLVGAAPGLLSLPNSAIPAGSKLTISLGNDAHGNVISVTFALAIVGSAPVSKTIDLLQVAPNSADVAPIVAFELNLVGPISSLQAYLGSGAGTITYTASTSLMALSQEPSCANPSSWGTAETANNVYGKLPQGSSTSITQSFRAVDPGAYAPGGPFAVSQQFGANQTDLFAIDRAGQLVVFFVEDAAHWSATTGLGPTGLARRGAAITASQQFGANQTDVFLVAQNGQLNVFWVEDTGAWNGPEPIGPTGKFPSGANLAACQQFGANQTDVFLVDNKGQLNVFWVDGSGSWNGPAKIGPKGLAPAGAALAASQQFGTNQTDVFLVDNNGQLNVFWVDGSGAWNGPEKIGPKGFAPPGAPLAASQQFGANQTDVFLVDNNGQLNVFWVDGSGAWNGPAKIGPKGIAPPGAPLAASQQFGANQTDVFLVDNNGQLNVFWVDGSGAWNGPTKIGPKGIAAPGAVLAASRQFGIASQTDLFVLNQTGVNAPGWPIVFWVEGSAAWNGPSALVTQG